MNDDDNHGHSTAAWTGTIIMIIAAAIASYAAVFGPVELMWGGFVLFVVGGIIWYIMSKAGLGGSGSTARR